MSRGKVPFTPAAPDINSSCYFWTITTKPRTRKIFNLTTFFPLLFLDLLLKWERINGEKGKQIRLEILFLALYSVHIFTRLFFDFHKARKSQN